MPDNAARLPPAMLSAGSPARLLLAQFVRFGLVGASGFVVDTATVYALRGPLGLYAAGVVAYVVASSSNWALNRVFTFREAPRRAAHRQWALFLAANLAGFVLNRGTYAALIATYPVFAAWPVLAVAAGTGAGMFVNFALSRAVVFR